MRVLTVYAHPNRKSFCHAILQQFTQGLAEAGHTSEVVDLYAIRFDPVFRTQDFASYVHDSMPVEILDQMDLKQHVLDSAGGPLQRFIAARWLRNKDSVAVAKFIHAHRPKDVIDQWEKLDKAQGLAFIALVFWLHFPAILKGWFERVFAYGDAYALSSDESSPAESSSPPLFSVIASRPISVAPIGRVLFTFDNSEYLQRQRQIESEPADHRSDPQHSDD